MLPRVVFIVALLVSASGFISPPVALAMGLVFGLTLPHPYGNEAKKFSKFLLQASVVGLGFGMNLHQVVRAGRSVFVLNSVALLIFPSIGTALKLTQSQFGLWAALAIHDTSSVVGAAAKYGAEALAIATTVKLARALWIVPLSIGTAVVRGAKAKIQWPWFIGLFCLAAVCNTYLPGGAHVYGIAVKVAKVGLTATLFLIGSGISVATIKEVGHRPLLQGILLWLLVSVGSLWLIRIGWIAL